MMKPIYRLLFVLISIASVLFLQSCGDKYDPCDDPDTRNQDCPNYNPCIDAVETSAKFTVQERIELFSNRELMPWGHNIMYETDTVIQNNEVIFTCTQKTDSIWWILDDIEMRPFWQQKQGISIRFGNSGNPEKLPVQVKVTCIVKNNRSNNCLPNDNGLDTFTRYIVYMPVFECGFIGTFRGSLVHKPDSVFNLTLRFDSLKTSQGLYIINIAFDELLTEPPYVSPIARKGFEYSNNGSGFAEYGYNTAYLFFNSLAGSDGISPSYKGKTIKGIAMYNGVTNTLKVDFIRHGTGIYQVTEWPPQNIPLLTFIGNKIN